ncbi:MAG: hypothetical protein IJC56_09620 [Clostridia bacterium]|nr:hypothetical protein [Clostridia bacterium]
MRQFISRPGRAALPLALGIYSLLVVGGAERALELMTALMLARGLSLCAGGALRAAAGAVVRASRLRGNLLTAAAMAVIGGILSALLWYLKVPVICEIGIWTIAAGALINISQVFADRMYSSEDFRSAVVYDVIIAALTTVALLISDTDAWLMAVLPGCGAAAGLMLLGGLKKGSSLQPGMKVLKYAPLAMLRGWLFPAVLTAAAMFFAELETDIAAAFIGITILEWCEPVFRRSDEESHASSVALSAISAVWIVICAVIAVLEPDMPEWYSRAPIINAAFAYSVPVACFGALTTGLHMNVRRVFLAALILFGMPLSLLLTIPDIIALNRIARAKRIQRKRR